MTHNRRPNIYHATRRLLSSLSPPHVNRNKLPLALLTLIVLAYLIRVGSTVSEFSQTVDEPYHLGSAVALYEARVHILGVQHPPLVRWVMGIPAVAMGSSLPEYAGTTFATKEDPAYAAGTKVLFSQGAGHYFDLLAATRMVMLVFPAIAMVYAFLLARAVVRSAMRSPRGPGEHAAADGAGGLGDRAGNLAGLAAALLLSLDATFLGHGMWICTDGAAVAAFLAILFHAVKYYRQPDTFNAAVMGLVLGLGIAAKFSVVAAVPGLLVVLAGHRYAHWRRPVATPHPPPTNLGLFGHVVLSTIVAFVAIWATYAFHVGPIGNSDTLAAAPQWEQIPRWVKETPVPMPSFWLGLGRLAAHGAGVGSTSYLLGEISKEGWWYYFPVTLAAKTPLALLVAMGLGLVVVVNRRWRELAVWALLVPAGLLMLAAMTGHIQIGIRHVLPIMAVLYVLAGVALTSSKAGRLALIPLALVALFETARFHPDYLSYFNAAAGGPAQGDRIAVDSNLDWGQDLARLARTVEADELPEGLPLSAIYPLGGRQAALLTVLGLDPELLDATPKPDTLVVVSLTRLKLEPDHFAAVLKGGTEVGRVGYGMAIYRMPSEETAR